MGTDNGSGSEQIIALVRQFNQALNQRDLKGMLALVTEDCRFENTYPPPDGSMHSGKEQMRSFWEDFFDKSSKITILEEEIFAHDDRCVMRWLYEWEDPSGCAGHVRGIDLYRVREGLISEKLSYVKG